MPTMLNGRPKAVVRATFRMVAMILGTLLTATAAADALIPAVERAARQHLEAWVQGRGMAATLVEVSARAPAGVQPDCAEPWEVAVAGSQASPRLRVSAVCPADGRSLSVPLRASVRARAWRLVRALPRAHRLTDGDVEATQVDVLSLGDAVVASHPPEGELRQRLPAGAIVQDRHLAQPAGVRRGESVRLLSGGTSFRVTVAATTLDAGTPGQVIRVRNTASGKTVKAKVVGAGAVEAIVGGS